MSLIQELQADLSQQAEAIIATVAERGYELIEPWPHRPGPRGPVRLIDGTVAHGAYATMVGDELDLVVVNNGWPIDHRRCPGPIPPSSAVLGPMNTWLSQQATLTTSGGEPAVIDPADAVLDRLVAGDKPFGLADLRAAADANVWRARAEAAGLVVDVEVMQHTDCTCDGEPVWLLRAARPERFADLLDLEALVRWYRTALAVAGASGAVERVTDGILRLRDRSPADYLDRWGEIIGAASWGWDGSDIYIEITGILLGYWPPTTAALISGHAADDLGSRRYPVEELDLWDRLRFITADQLLGNLDLWL